jgi:AcrR family transcriptional regulator
MNTFIKGARNMPKVIENLQETILHKSKQLLLESGYEAFTMRDAASRCGIAVGTLYNYFPSKEALAAGVMLEDWRIVLSEMQSDCAAAKTLGEGLEVLYQGIVRFSKPYQGIWAGYGFSGSQNLEYARRHRMLVRQLAACLWPLLAKEKAAPLPQADLFLAENVLICAGSSEMDFAAFQAIAQRMWGTSGPDAGLSE